MDALKRNVSRLVSAIGQMVTNRHDVRRVLESLCRSYLSGLGLGETRRPRSTTRVPAHGLAAWHFGWRQPAVAPARLGIRAWRRSDSRRG